MDESALTIDLWIDTQANTASTDKSRPQHQMIFKPRKKDSSGLLLLRSVSVNEQPGRIGPELFGFERDGIAIS
jgi:hypothetical protein